MWELFSPQLKEALQIAFTQNDLNLLTEAVARLLRNPIAVYSANYRILAYSSTDCVRDPVWLAGMKRGYCRYEYAAQLSKLALHPAEDACQVLTDVGELRRRQAMLHIGGVPVGYFSVLENQTPFEEIPDEIYAVAARLLAKEVSFSRTGGPAASGDSSKGMLLDLLDGNFANRMLFHQRLSGSELDVAATFRLITIDMSAFPGARTGRRHLRAALDQLLPASWSVFYAQSVVVLINEQLPFYCAPRALVPLREYLEQEKLRGCISDRFDDLYHTKEHYTRTLRTLELSRELGDPEPLLYYEDYKLLQILRTLSADEIPLLCSAPVWSIFQRDYLDKTDNLKTLFTYLHCGKSLQKTAEILFVHRNTVAYRIQKIKERYGIDFQNSYQTAHHYVSCMMVLASKGLTDPFWHEIFCQSVHPAAGEGRQEQMRPE